MLLQAQNQKILDSLQTVYRNSPSDTSKILLLTEEIAFQYYRNRPDTTILIAERALAWSEKIKFEKGIAWSYNRIGISYYSTSNYPLALEYTQKGLAIFEKIGAKKGTAISLNNLGLIYMEQGNYPPALSCYTRALKLFEEVGIGTKRGIAVALRNIGRVYDFQKNHELALEYHLKSLKIKEEIKDKIILGVSLNDIAKIYITQKKYDLALEYVLKSLKIQEEMKDKLGKAQCLASLSIIYRQRQEYNKSIEFAEQSLRLAQEVKAANQAKESSALLYETYKETKEYDKALVYLELSKSINDSIFNIDKSKSIANIESKIALEKKEQAIKMLEKDNELIKLATENQARQLAIAKKEAEANWLFAAANQEKSKRKADSLHALAQRTQLESDKLRAEDAKLKAENKTQAVENQKQKEEKDFQQKINYLISISLLIVVVFAFFVFQSRKRMSKAFRNLEEANTLVQQKKEEIEIQTEELQQTNDTLQKTLQFVNYQNKEINSSVKYALQIQTAMLPILADFEQVFPESFILFKPRDIVSGDFYWFAEVKKQGKSYTIVAVADCTGHGVPGAFLFMIGCNILNNLVKENRVTEPERILTLLDKELRKTLQQDSNKSKDGMDMQIVTITKNIEQQDIEASFDKIEYAGAMNPLYYVENQVFHEIKATKLPIGGGTDTNKVFDKHIIVLQKNTDGAKNNTSFIMYLTTDGFQDQFGGKESRKFMTRRFRELLLNISPKPMSEQKEILEKTITEWIVFGREQQTDDITIMGICLYS